MCNVAIGGDGPLEVCEMYVKSVWLSPGREALELGVFVGGEE